MRLAGERGVRLPRMARPRSLDDALLPLINIVFLLMIFFLFVGRIGGPQVPSATPKSREADATTAAAAQVLELADGGRCQVDGTEFADTELALRAVAWKGGKVDVRATGLVSAERVLRVLADLRRAGVGEVRLLTVRTAR